MKKICILKYSFDNVGGTERVAVNLANEFSKKYEIHLVSILESENIRFFDLSSSVTYQSFLGENVRVRHAMVSGTQYLRKYVIKNKIDIILSVGVQSNIFMILATIGLKVRTVSCDHMAIQNNYGSRSYAVQRWMGAKLSSKIVVLTEDNMKGYIKKYKISRKKITFIYNWIKDTTDSILQDENEKKRLLTVGRFVEEKGYDYLQEIAEKVLDRHTDWVWDICGDGDIGIKNQLQRFIKEKGFEDNIILHGNVKDMDEVYRKSGIYVMTSRYEGLPLVLLEAKQYGLPIISFDCPTGPSEIVRDGKNGYLVKDFDTQKMADYINSLIENEKQRECFSENAYLDVDRFSKDNILKQWDRVIEGE